jgi:hypothetical protein
MKKPIILIDEFISPLRCISPNVLDYVDQKTPQLISIIEQYYDVKIKNVTKAVMLNECRLTCDNSIYKSKWIKVNEYDFSCYIPLVTYNNKPPFDIETEVYGGSLTFTSFKTKYKPVIGRLIIFPSAPNFVHIHEEAKFGTFNYVKVFLTCETPFVYNYKQWNNNL